MGTINRLTESKIRKTNEPRKLNDGGGLYLRVYSKGRKNWVFRYYAGRAPLTDRPIMREMGLGSHPEVSIEQARIEAARWRDLVRKNIDPIKARKKERREVEIAEAKATTFKEYSENYRVMQQSRWSSAKHRDQWKNTLSTYVYPIIGHLPVSEIDTHLIKKVLLQKTDDSEEPFWFGKRDTAYRLLGRLETVFDAAIHDECHPGPNPARWKGGHSTYLPSRVKPHERRHHAALKYQEVAAFMTKLGEQEGIAARALEFTILTAARTSETILATWEEFDLEKRVWTVPAARMKARKEHRVPLSEPVMNLLKAIKGERESGYVFCGRREGKPLSNMAMLVLLKRMKRDDLTTHGFRSSFRDWADERNFPHHVAEMALAHAIRNATEAAYRRGDLFERRAEMMEAWAKHCFTPVTTTATVIPFKSASNS